MILRFALLTSLFFTAHAFAAVTIVPDNNHETMAARDAGIQALAATGTNHRCLFLEVPTNFTPALMAYMTGRKTYENSVARASAQYQHQIGMEFFNIVPDGFLSQAAGLGARAYGVDITEGSAAERREAAIMREMGPYFGNEGGAPTPLFTRYIAMLNERSAIMASNIARLVRAGTCGDSVLIVGQAHTLNQALGVPMTPVAAHLQSMGIAVR